MIELLNARRMIIVIGVLIALCIIIVILEDTITDHVDKPTPYLEHHRKQQQQQQEKQQNKKNNNSPVIKLPPSSDDHLNNQSDLHASISSGVFGEECWQREAFTIKMRCTPCKAKERHLPACLDTGYHEHLHCAQSGVDVFRSCDTVTSFFWVFQFFMICLSVVFNFYVKRRQSYLNRVVLDRIEKQIASGV